MLTTRTLKISEKNRQEGARMAYYSQNRHPEGWTWRDEKPMPLGRKAIIFLILAVFVGIVGDFSWVPKAVEKEKERMALWDSQQGKEYLREISEIVSYASQQASAGTFSIEDCVKTRWRLLWLIEQLGIENSSEPGIVYDAGRESYIQNWQMDDSLNENLKKILETDPIHRTAWIKSEFSRKIQLKNEELRPDNMPPIELNLKKIGLWLVKWYFLMTIPGFFIMLVCMRHAGKKVKEEIILNWRRILLAAIFGPLGLCVASESAGRMRRYYRFRDEFLTDKGWDYRLSQAEEDAIWIQAMEPVLRFDQAMAALKESGGKIKRPALACFLAWMIGLVNIHSSHFAKAPTVFIVTVSSNDEIDGNKPSDFSGGQWQPELAILPTTTDCRPAIIVTVLARETPRQRPRELSIGLNRPRGPPRSSSQGKRSWSFVDFFLTAQAERKEQ